MGPGWPVPMVRSSISRTGVISAAVPVRKTSSAMCSRSRLSGRSSAGMPRSLREGQHRVAGDAVEDCP